MSSTRICVALFGLVFALTSNAQTNHYQEVKASGSPEASLCGFNVNKTSMKEIFTRLGEAESKKQDSDNPNYTTFSWEKGSLKIDVSAYVENRYPLDHPASIAVQGIDASGICKTGRGLLLGDPASKALKLYAKGRGKIALAKEGKPVSFRWGEEDGELALTISRNGRVTRIEVVPEE